MFFTGPLLLLISIAAPLSAFTSDELLVSFPKYNVQVHPNICHATLTFRVLKKSMLNGTYATDPDVRVLSDNLFQCSPNIFEAILFQVVSEVTTQSRIGYGKILNYIGSHSYSDQIVIGLRVVYKFLGMNGLLDGPEIRKLARMLKIEEENGKYKNTRTPGIIKELKGKLSKKVKEEVWGEEKVE